MNKLKTLLIPVILATLPSCAGSKKTAVHRQNNRTGQALPTVKMSAFARLFITELEADVNRQNQTISFYKPSQVLIEKYGLLLFKNEYLVRGIVTTNDQLNRAELAQLRIAIGAPVGNNTTISIPLPNFFQFLNLKGIEYFEMNPKNQRK